MLPPLAAHSAQRAARTGLGSTGIAHDQRDPVRVQLILKELKGWAQFVLPAFRAPGEQEVEARAGDQGASVIGPDLAARLDPG